MVLGWKVIHRSVDKRQLLAIAPFCVIAGCLFARIANLQRLQIRWLGVVMVGKCGTLSASLDKSFSDVVIASNRRFTVLITRRWRKANNKRHKHRNHLTDRKL